MRGAVPDNAGIAMGNAIELFFLPDLGSGKLLEYIHFIGNARGCVYDSLAIPQVGVTYVAEFNVPWEFRNKVTEHSWIAEISASFKDLKIDDTSNGKSFDFDLGRDGGSGPNGVHSYQMAFHRIQDGKGVKVVFDPAAPIAQWLSFGDFEHHRFSPKLRLVGTRGGTYVVTFLVTDATLSTDKTYETLFKKSETVTLKPGQAADVTADFSLAKDAKGRAHYLVTDAAGKVIFRRLLPFTCDLSAPSLYQQTKPSPLAVNAKMGPSCGRIGVSADIIDYSGPKDNVAVKVSAVRESTGKILDSIVIDRFRLDYGQGILNVGSITSGKYRVDFEMIDKTTGKPLGARKSVSLVRTIYPWENNTLGMSEKVIAPWIPMEVHGQVVSCWGRKYQFNGLALPMQIDTYQPNPTRSTKTVQDVLDGPVRIVAGHDGKDQAFTPGTKKIAKQSETEVDLTGTGTAPGLKAAVTGRLEYDGFYKIHLTITATDGPVKLDSLRVEVPMKTSDANLFHHVGESMRTNKTFADFAGRDDGVLWNSKDAACNAVIKGNFVPVIWMGNEDRGISWMCDTDRTWRLDFEKPALDVVRKGDETSFRMHLINTPAEVTKDKPVDVTFSLQATPFRSRPAGGSWKLVEWYGWSHFDKPLLWPDCFKPYAEGKGYRWLRTDKARRKDIWWRYGCMSSDRIPETDPVYGQMIKDFGGEWYSDNIWTKYDNKSHQDFELWAYEQWCDKAGMDGVYFDNTFPSPATNLLNGQAYMDETGRLRPGYGVMGMREFLKRLRTMLLSKGPAPVLKAHITDTPDAGYLGFADFWMDGENGGYPSDTMNHPDFVDRWYNPKGLANLRITLGGQWGTMPQYLYAWGIDPTYAVLGMFDLEHQYRPFGKEPYFEFGRFEEDVVFIPYWNINPPVTVASGGPDVRITAWKRPKRARVLVSNCSNEDRTVSLNVDLKALGLSDKALAMDERKGTQIPMTGGKITGVRVGRHNYEVLILAEPGLYKPLPADFGAALDPPKKRWIPELCDAFTCPKPGWTEMVSAEVVPSNTRVPFKPVRVAHGMLRTRSGSATFCNLRRPFNRDNVTVQVMAREPTAAYLGGFGPALSLKWKDGQRVLMAFGERGTGKLYVRGLKVDGTTSAFYKEGPDIKHFVWMKIELARRTSSSGTAPTGRRGIGFSNSPARAASKGPRRS